MIPDRKSQKQPGQPESARNIFRHYSTGSMAWRTAIQQLNTCRDPEITRACKLSAWCTISPAVFACAFPFGKFNQTSLRRISMARAYSTKMYKVMQLGRNSCPGMYSTYVLLYCIHIYAVLFDRFIDFWGFYRTFQPLILFSLPWLLRCLGFLPHQDWHSK